MMVSGSDDVVTPALAEQIRPFTWLEAPERYLLLMPGSTHFSTIFDPQATSEPIPIPEEIIGSNTELAQRYVKIMSLIFFKTYLTEDTTYNQYLSDSSQIDMPVSQRTNMPILLTHQFTLENQ